MIILSILITVVNVQRCYCFIFNSILYEDLILDKLLSWFILIEVSCLLAMVFP